jgi:hypothetical protein
MRIKGEGKTGEKESRGKRKGGGEERWGEGIVEEKDDREGRRKKEENGRRKRGGEERRYGEVRERGRKKIWERGKKE